METNLDNSGPMFENFKSLNLAQSFKGEIRLPSLKSIPSHPRLQSLGSLSAAKKKKLKKKKKSAAVSAKGFGNAGTSDSRRSFFRRSVMQSSFGTGPGRRGGGSMSSQLPSGGLFEEFVRAVRYVRGSGAAAIHPGAKVRLFALMIQAQKGDAPVDRSAKMELIGGDEGNQVKVRIPRKQSVMMRMKEQAWRSKAGLSRVDAMVEFISLLSEINPHWKLSNVLRSVAEAGGGPPAPKTMVWVLRVSFEKVARILSPPLKMKQSGGGAVPPTESVMLSPGSGKSCRYIFTDVEIVQASNDTNSREWTDLGYSVNKSGKEGEEAEDDIPEFIRNLPLDLGVHNVNTNSEVFRSVEDQDKAFAGKSRWMYETFHCAEAYDISGLIFATSCAYNNRGALGPCTTGQKRDEVDAVAELQQR